MTNFAFATPAFIQDLKDQPDQQATLNNAWNAYVGGWVQQAMPPSPSFYYDPATTPVPAGSPAAQISWSAFPGRLMQYCSDNPPIPPANPNKLKMSQVYSLADTGFYLDSNGVKKPLPDIPTVFCPQADWSGELQSYGPYGPRGWLDEYVEWSVARNGSGSITRVDFCCENPEYWYALWSVSPDRVVALYNEILNAGAPAAAKVTVTLDDLTLKNAGGQTVYDPTTKQPAYNPLNKWNSGTQSLRGTGNDSGGAIHLTSTPNTLQTELGLAGISTEQFASGNANAQALLCCGQFGQAYRNSDPHIGQSVSQVVAGALTGGAPQLANLANPFGLYIQMPNFSGWTFASRVVVGQNVPNGAKPSDIWTVLRGDPKPKDPVTGDYFPSNSSAYGSLILHAVCQIPASWLALDPTLTLADILINGAPVAWAGQIAQQFDMALYARPLTAGGKPPQVPCSSGSGGGSPVQCFHRELWDAYYAVAEPNPTGFTIPLASNTTFIPPAMKAGTTTPRHFTENNLTLIVSNPLPGGVKVSVETGMTGGGNDPNIIATVLSSTVVTYSVPGNSYPGTYTAINLAVLVGGAEPGLRAVTVTSGGNSATLAAAVNILARN